MTKEQYDDYRKTEHWAELKRQRLAIDNNQCCFCGSRGTTINPLVLHHFNYRSLGHENVYKDVMILCRSCHRGVHTMMSRTTSPDGKQGWGSSLPYNTHVFELSDGEVMSIEIQRRAAGEGETDD